MCYNWIREQTQKYRFPIYLIIILDVQTSKYEKKNVPLVLSPPHDVKTDRVKSSRIFIARCCRPDMGIITTYK